MNKQTLLLALATTIMIGASGCATIPEMKANSQRETSFTDRLPFVGKKKEDEPEPYPSPAKIAATWTPDNLVQAGRTPTRGFGGRVFFYDERSRPVPVEGTLVVHGFDDTATDASQRVKRYEFTPDQLTRHFSQSDLGASYSVWIPWDAIGGEQRRISLIASFQTEEGKTVQGLPATVVLPGRAPQDPAQELASKYSPEYLKYRQAQTTPSQPVSGLTTTTIRRQRLRPNVSPGKVPAITIPQVGDRVPMIASSKATPSVDIDMAPQKNRSHVLPASAQMPLQR